MILTQQLSSRGLAVLSNADVLRIEEDLCLSAEEIGEYYRMAGAERFLFRQQKKGATGMRRFLNSRYLGLAAFLFSVFLASGAFAAEESYILKGGKVYRVEAGKETLLEDEEPGRTNTDKGFYSWILVDPKLSGKMQGSKSGIYFFLGGDERPVGFMPLEAASFSDLEFSPDGEEFLLSWGTDAVQELSLYVFDGFVKKKSFTALGYYAWLEPHRFVFTQDDTSKGSRGKAVERQEGWLSVALYDAAVEELYVLEEATETQDFILTGIDHEKGVLEVLERSVKDKKDWDDAEKVEEKETTIPIPAAG